MPAVDKAAMDHQLMPWLPVWLAIITQRVRVRRGEQRCEEILVPAQDQREDEGRDHAGKHQRHDDAAEGAPDGKTVDKRRLLQLDRNGGELVAHDPDDDRQHHQRINRDQAAERVQQRQLLVEHEERQREHDRRHDELRQEEEGNVGVPHMAELVGEAAEPIGRERARNTASAEAVTEMIALLNSRCMNSSRTVEVWKSASGESPSERQPSQLGANSSQGIMLPFITSGAVLNEVETVQNSGKKLTMAQVISRP